jgi:hypothetical protein
LHRDPIEDGARIGIEPFLARRTGIAAIAAIIGEDDAEAPRPEGFRS